MKKLLLLEWNGMERKAILVGYFEIFHFISNCSMNSGPICHSGKSII